IGRVDFGAMDTINEEAGSCTGILTGQDPVQNRRVMGVARVDLSQKRVDFYTLGPAAWVSFALAPGRKRAYGLHNEIGRYEFWTFDLENRKLHNKSSLPAARAWL